jgi:hypothetical protein
MAELRDFHHFNSLHGGVHGYIFILGHHSNCALQSRQSTANTRGKR